MTRRSARGRRAAAALLASLIGAMLACSAEPARPPSILLVTIDTLRPDYLSLNGYDRETTPKLDAVIREGVYFERAITPIARTTPALASLLAGSYPHTTGVRTLTDSLASGVTSIAEVLRGAGYQTLAVVSNQVLVRRRGLDRGFDLYDMAADDRDARATTQAALSHLAAVDPTAPVFAWVHYIDPHAPYHTEAATAEKMDPGYSGRYRFRFGRARRSGEPRNSHRAFPEDLPKRAATHRNALPEAVNAHIRRLYAADVHSLDGPLDRLLTSARRTLNDPIVVLTADHGESLGEHDFYFDHGDYVFNAATRVPLAIILPRDHPWHRQGRCESWCTLVDVAPTLLELVDPALTEGIAHEIEGRSLVPCLRGSTLPDEPVFAESGTSYFFDAVRGRVRNDIAGRFRSVTHGNWKLVWTPFAADDEAWMLFDVAADPSEVTNLYRPDHPALPPLRAALEGWLARQPEPSTAPSLTREDVEALRELGYLEPS